MVLWIFSMTIKKHLRRLKKMLLGALCRKDAYVIEGVVLPIDRKIMSNLMVYSIAIGRYERKEARLLRSNLRNDDRVLELGAGLGFISTLAAKLSPNGSVCCVEANPYLIGQIQRTHKLNHVKVDIMNAVVSSEPAPARTFYLREQFWDSSLSKEPNNYVEQIEVSNRTFADLAAKFRPTVIVADIEGGEIELLQSELPEGVRAFLVEVHPKMIGADNVQKMLKYFTECGFSAHLDGQMLVAQFPDR